MYNSGPDGYTILELDQARIVYLRFIQTIYRFKIIDRKPILHMSDVITLATIANKKGSKKSP